MTTADINKADLFSWSYLYTNLFFVSAIGHANRGDRVALLENEIIKENKVTIKDLVF